MDEILKQQIAAAAATIRHSNECGQVFFNTVSGEIWWDAADVDDEDGMSTDEEIIQLFSSIPGVTAVEIECEVMPGYTGWGDGPEWVEVDYDRSIAEKIEREYLASLD